MIIDLDTHSGFCFGVTSAIHKAEEELARGALCCLGDIVHNGQEVERLEAMGLQTIGYEQLATMRGGRVLLRAHGEPPSTYQMAQQNGIEIIDASCPVVLHLQQRIRTTYEEHPKAQIAIFGKVGHAEVIGLQGQTNNTARVIEGIQDIESIDFSKDIYLFSQTTKSVDEFHAIVRAIEQRLEGIEEGRRPKFYFYDTICRNVSNRVKELREFAQAHDYVLFVGGKKSSNAKVLFEQCKQANEQTYFVSSADELDTAWVQALPEQARVGICGATSTPLWLMEECKKKIQTVTI